MPTPQHVFSELACRFGKVNPLNPVAVDEFFKNLSSLPVEDRKAIQQELLDRAHEPQNELDEILLDLRVQLAEAVAPPEVSGACGLERLDPLPLPPPARPKC